MSKKGQGTGIWSDANVGDVGLVEEIDESTSNDESSENGASVQMLKKEEKKNISYWEAGYNRGFGHGKLMY